ncbi:MAG TPA: MarR family transcriptional regulator [Nitrososphaeraceae archaeon]|nr:MarR family transcriptional regulator [Nitrososphaeraceae archaeon]
MSSGERINDSPRHFMILDAVARGIQDLNKIAKALKMSKEEVELIINDLSTQRLIIRKEKKGFFGNKKLKISITETGIKILNSKKEELEQKWRRAQKMYNNGKGNKTQLQSYMENNRAWVPLMIFSGIMDVVFFMTMMSFLGMALNPAEQSMAGDSGAEGAAGGESGTEQASTGGDTADTGGDSGDFGGFDMGGFGDF